MAGNPTQSRQQKAIDTLTIRNRYPCCGKPARLEAIIGVWRERYERRCRPCETTWDVVRQMLVEKDGIRVDRLEWEDTKGRRFRFLYGNG